MERSHAYFDELCAMAAVNETSAEENERLARHASSCPACREAIEQYSLIAAQSYAESAADAGGAEASEEFAVDPREQQKAKRTLLRDIGRTIELPLTGGVPQPPGRIRKTAGRRGSFVPAWAGWAAAAALLVALGGESRQYLLTQKNSRDVEARTASLQRGLGELRTELERVRAASQVADVKASPAPDSEVTKRLLAENQSLKKTVEESESERQRDASELAQVRERVKLLQSSLDMLQTSSTGLEAERTAMSEKVANLVAELRKSQDELTVVNARNEELSQQALTKVKFAERQQKLLATDHDIRDILGARSLRIIDVRDVGSQGEFEPAFGRIFYTEGKSLVFYAFDLDQQKGLKRGTIFQAWGQKGESKDTPHSLGAFYVDDPAQNRWVLKVDDPKVLSRVDYVFVTDSSRKEGVHPKGRPLLSASLDEPANHP